VATLSPAQIYALARNAGLPAVAATLATAVALAESGGRTDAMGDVGLQDATWGPSVGLWQIRSLKAQYGTGQPRDASRLTDPQFNASSMASISGGGKNFGPWSTYKNGAYKKYLLGLGTNPDITADAGLSQVGLGDLGQSAQAAGANTYDKAATLLKDLTAGGFLGLALKVVAGGAAAALVIVGALHTVSDK
jgi:hypothetical protein